MDTKSFVIWIIFVAVCAVIVIISKRIRNQIDRDGIETVGVISRIETGMDVDDLSLEYYAKYFTEDGEEIEGTILNPTRDLDVGQQVRLKYHPKLKTNARLIK